MPVFQHYFWAANVRALMYWNHSSPCSDQNAAHTPSWILMESHSVNKSSLPALLLANLSIPLKNITKNFVVHSSLRILKQVKKFIGVTLPSLHSPICENHIFTPALSDRTFQVWNNKGLSTFNDLYTDGHFSSFDNLLSKYHLTHSHFFRYLQIRHYVQQTYSDYRIQQEEHCFYNLVRQAPDSRHMVSQFVSLFSTQVITSSDYLRVAWEKEAGISLSDNIWSEILKRIHSCSINARLQLIQFKIVHRLHYSKTRLHKIYPAVSPMCDRCQVAEGTLSHAFCSCLKLQRYWEDIFSWYSVAYDHTLPPEMELAIFGYSDTVSSLPDHLQLALMLGMVVAKRIILKDWKATAPPCFQKWLAEMVSVLNLEKIRLNESKSLNFSKIWGPFLQHLHNSRT